MNKDDPIRDPDKLVYADHLGRRARERNFGAHEVNKAIREGVYDPDGGNKPSDVSYRLEIPGVDFIAIVDSRNDKITTGYYDDEQGANKGGI